MVTCWLAFLKKMPEGVAAVAPLSNPLKRTITNHCLHVMLDSLLGYAKSSGDTRDRGRGAPEYLLLYGVPNLR